MAGLRFVLLAVTEALQRPLMFSDVADYGNYIKYCRLSIERLRGKL